MLNFIPDGYTEDGYVAEKLPMHGAMRFKFRPLLVEEQSAYFRAADGVKKDARDQAAAKMIAERLVEWDVADQAGTVLGISPTSILRLRPALFSRVYGIILGTEGSDIDPTWPQTQKQEAAGQQYESALTGRNVGIVRQEGNEKNSAAG